MPIIKSSLETIRDYFANSGLNQSELKKYSGSLNELLYNREKEDDTRLLFAEDAQYNIIGSAVDLLLTGTLEDFHETYHISSLSKPSPLVISILKNVLQLITTNNKQIDALVFFKEEIHEAINAHDYQTNWKTETRINKIIELGADYFEEIKISLEKTIISSEDMCLIEKIVTSFHKAYPRLFGDVDAGPDYDIYHQLPIYWNYKSSQPAKALLDVVVHKKSTDEVFIYDIKTTAGMADDFQKAVHSYRYDIQSAWYTEAVKVHFNTVNENIKFKFIVQSKLYVGKPVEFEATTDFLVKAITGVPERTTLESTMFGKLHGVHKQPIFGINDLISMRSFYLRTDFTSDYRDSKILLY